MAILMMLPGGWRRFRSTGFCRRITNTDPGRQVVRALSGGATIHSVFDADGNRIAEYDQTSGALIREYVWFDGAAVAVIEGGVVYYLRSDHIGRPVFATNAAGVQVWSASYLPFGGVRTATGTPITLRFPGQWFQSESGLHQNWMRDYDPTTGRYLQADPLGLVDGASVYGYARQSPAMVTDPTGQCPWCIVGAIYAGWMIYDYLSDEGCYTWGDFAYSAIINNPYNPFKWVKWAKRAGKGYRGSGHNSGAAGGGNAGEDIHSSTPTGSRGNEMGVPSGPNGGPSNTPTTINGRDYSGHSIDRMQERGYGPTVVENVISMGTPNPGNTAATTRFYGATNNISVVIDNVTGRVVTVRGGG